MNSETLRAFEHGARASFDPGVAAVVATSSEAAHELSTWRPIAMATNTKTGLAERAHRELPAAGDALFRVRALLNLIQIAMDEGGELKCNISSLVATGIELAATYAERADGEAEYFSDICSRSQGDDA
ncbi:hypothetical protein PQR64_24020 [Paraburkholderia phytofirmans]|uniref:hypothetical protein n=1 Tax=Paraburkholderia phytofirmans TaxID=261302 RepID=UPI0038BD4937